MEVCRPSIRVSLRVTFYTVVQMEEEVIVESMTQWCRGNCRVTRDGIIAPGQA